ncbi:MAG TPA: NAD(P)-dependent oxidoreductase [Anaerolineae bacterium]|nr:NAD(P)-dependent oxidoreductase [Anaerolineae bacterium]
MIHVHIARPPDEAARAIFEQELAPNFTITYGPDRPPSADYHILVQGRPSPAELDQAPNLHAVIVPWAGIPPETLDLVRQRPHLSLHNLHYNAQPVAELTFALLLAAAKFIVPLDQALRQHDWTPRYQPPPSMLLSGKQGMILGYGAIGQALAPLCQAIGMKLWGVRRQLTAPYQDAHHVSVISADDWESRLPQTDVLLITLPLTAVTENIIDAPQLAALPPGAVLVNVGRGPLVNARALYEVLRDGHLRAAALDVWYNYPQSPQQRTKTPPAPVPLETLPNIVMSPHRGGTTDEKEDTRWTHLAQLLNTAVANKTLANQVDLDQGY